MAIEFSAEQLAYMQDGAATKALGSMLGHENWRHRVATTPPLNQALAKVSHFRPIKPGPDGQISKEDMAWIEQQVRQRTGLAMLADGVWHHELWVSPAQLSPAGVKLNYEAAVAEWDQLIALVKAGKLNPLTDAEIPAHILEPEAAKLHDTWRVANRYRTDADFVRQDVAFEELLREKDGVLLQEQDRQRLRMMWQLIREFFPKA